MQFIRTEVSKKLLRAGIDTKPVRARERDAGYDLRLAATETVVLAPNEVKLLPTGTRIFLGSAKVPEGKALAGLVMNKSSSNFVVLNNAVGLVDEGYQGEIFAKVHNRDREEKYIQPGEQIGQLVIVEVRIDELVELDTEDFPVLTDRGQGGHGSTINNKANVETTK